MVLQPWGDHPIPGTWCSELPWECADQLRPLLQFNTVNVYLERHEAHMAKQIMSGPGGRSKDACCINLSVFLCCVFQIKHG